MELINSKYFYEANSYLHRRKKIGEKILNLHFLYNRTLNEFPDGKAGRKRGKSSNNFWFFSRRANKSLRKLWKRYRFLNWFHFLFRILSYFFVDSSLWKVIIVFLLFSCRGLSSYIRLRGGGKKDVIFKPWISSSDLGRVRSVLLCNTRKKINH